MNTFPIPPQQARYAGLLYLIIILCGVGSEVALRGPLSDLGSAEATANAIEPKRCRSGCRSSLMSSCRWPTRRWPSYFS